MEVVSPLQNVGDFGYRGCEIFRFDTILWAKGTPTLMDHMEGERHGKYKIW